MNRPSKKTLAGKIARCEERIGYHRSHEEQQELVDDLLSLKPSTLRWLLEMTDDMVRYVERNRKARAVLSGRIS